MRSLRLLWLVSIAALCVGATAAPVVAAGREPTGDRIGLFAGDREYPAGTAFHVAHGVGALLGEDIALGRGSFTLEVDGVPQSASYTERSVEDGLLADVWVFNYPEGMSGTHTFTGHWFSACAARTAGLPCGEDGRRSPVEFETAEIVVTFTE